MYATIRDKKENYSQYYLLHCIEGINVTVLGDNLIATFITEDISKYELYIQVKRKSPILDKHKQFINSFIVDGTIIYTMGILDKDKKEYRKFRNNNIEGFSEQFKEQIYKLSGYPYRKYNPLTTKKDTCSALALLNIETLPHYIVGLLRDIRAWGLYDEFGDIPFVTSSCGITSWTGFDAFIKSIEDRKTPVDRVLGLIEPDHKFANIDEHEFIENIYK